MQGILAALTVFGLSGLFSADAQSPGESSARAAIDKGLAFLTKDALAWKKEHNCVSCHHASLVVWSMREAKGRGHAVDEAVLAELTKWVADSGDGTTSVPRPAGIPKALNTKAVYFALALEVDPKPDALEQDGIKRYLGTVKRDQTDNGSWASWPETRPPIFGNSDDSMTAMASLSLVPAAAGDTSAKSALDKGVQWLLQTKSDDDPQSIAMRLVLWKRLGRPAEECQSLVQRIGDRQNADGGWCQASGMASDAWATGQALYALANAEITPDDPVIARAHTFLIKTQRRDGSWPMTSRPIKPGGEGSKSLIPITGAGSAWAVIGLARSR